MAQPPPPQQQQQQQSRQHEQPAAPCLPRSISAPQSYQAAPAGGAEQPPLSRASSFREQHTSPRLQAAPQQPSQPPPPQAAASPPLQLPQSPPQQQQVGQAAALPGSGGSGGGQDWTVVVANLGSSMTAAQLESYFRARFPSVTGAAVPVWESTGEPKGFAFVRFSW